MRHLLIAASMAIAGSTVASATFGQSLETRAAASDPSDAETAENIDALPGLFRVIAAGTMRPGLALGLTVGYGYTEDVLQLEDKHHRMRGALAASYRPLSWLAAGARLDGRYDRHSGSMIASDDGWVGEARFNVLAASSITDTMGVGLALVGWLPGGISGLSLDAKAIGTATLGPVRVSGHAGFRLDRSAESVDDADALSQSDRLALGVSDSNAVLVGAGAETRLGAVDLLGEITWDVLVGDSAPPLAESPLRLGVGARFAVSDAYRITTMLEGSVGRAPFVAAMEPLVPVEPLVAISVTLSQRPARVVTQTRGVIEPLVGDDDADDDDDDPVDVKPRSTLAGLSGTVRDGEGEPIAGAVVQVAGREVLTGDDGSFVAEKLEPGGVSVSVSADGFIAATESVTVASDEVRSINIILKRIEAGELRGVVRGFDGRPLETTVKISPGDHEVTSDADGTFRIKLPAGEYTATATAKGFRTGSARATIKVPGPVVIINIELRKAK